VYIIKNIKKIIAFLCSVVFCTSVAVWDRYR